MEVFIKKQHSTLCNKDIKWYLSDQSLWITKYDEYADIEESIGKSVGSFNWLYPINDTILFNEEDRRFETAIIDLAGKIPIVTLEEIYLSTKNEQRGDLFFAQKENYCDFEFSSPVVYMKEKDFLISFPVNLGEKDFLILFIADDFGFLIHNNQLLGWILKNASNHICISQETSILSDDNQDLAIMSDNNQDLLEKYFDALRLWDMDEEDEVAITELKSLMNVVANRKDALGLAIWECIRNILEV